MDPTSGMPRLKPTGSTTTCLKFLGVMAVIYGGSMTVMTAGPLRAAVVKRDITPQDSQWLLGYGPRRSEEVHDPLYHRILVLDDGRRPFVLVSSDLCAFSPDFYDDFCKQLKQQTGIERDQFWWTVTHTHTGPELGPLDLAKAFMPERFEHEWDRAYAERTATLLIEGVKEALAGLEPARIGVGTGTSLANTNRRARDAEGAIHLGINPYGPVDRQIGLIRLERPDGSLLALVANYAMHGTVLGGIKQISGDAPGLVAAYVEEKLGAPMLYINGAAGNIGPLYFFLGNFRRFSEFNVLLGDRILEANRSIRVDERAEIELEFGEIVVETPMKPDLPWPAALYNYQRTSAAGEKQVRVPVRFLKLSEETLLWSAPLELFCEIALQVRNASPFAHTFYFGYANGWLGYMPTAIAFPEGGYETTVTPFTPQVEEDFSQAVIQFLHGFSR